MQTNIEQSIYTFSDGNIQISLEIDFLSKNFTITNPSDFEFVACKGKRPETIAKLMLAAVQHARMMLEPLQEEPERMRVFINNKQ